MRRSRAAMPNALLPHLPSTTRSMCAAQIAIKTPVVYCLRYRTASPLQTTALSFDSIHRRVNGVSGVCTASQRQKNPIPSAQMNRTRGVRRQQWKWMFALNSLHQLKQIIWLHWRRTRKKPRDPGGEWETAIRQQRKNDEKLHVRFRSSARARIPCIFRSFAVVIVVVVLVMLILPKAP